MTVQPATNADALAAWRLARTDDDPLNDPAYFAAMEAAGVSLSVVGESGPPFTVVRAFRTGPFNRAGVPPFTPFNPILLGPDDGESAIHRGESSLQRLADGLEAGFDDVIVHIPPDVSDVRPLQWRGWTVEPRYTYRLDPAVAADPASWSASARRNARTHGSDYQVSEDPDASGTVAALCHASYARHARPAPLPEDAMAALCRALCDGRQARCFVASHRSGPAAAALALLQAPTIAYYWMAGSEPGPAMTVLLAHVLARLADEGVQRFDFVGANTPGIAEFKRRFNPAIVTYHAARRTPSRAFRLLRALRNAGGR